MASMFSSGIKPNFTLGAGDKVIYPQKPAIINKYEAQYKEYEAKRNAQPKNTSPSPSTTYTQSAVIHGLNCFLFPANIAMDLQKK